MRKQWNTVLVIALILVVVIFAVLNVDPVDINFGFTSVAMPLVIVIIGTLLIGVLIAVIWSTTILVRERNYAKKLTQQLDQHNAQSNEEKEQLKQSLQDEKQALEKRYEDEKGNLQAVIHTHETEIRELNRRIKNMETTRTVDKDDTNHMN